MCYDMKAMDVDQLEAMIGGANQPRKVAQLQKTYKYTLVPFPLWHFSLAESH